jgi:hypothetical protein
LIMGKEESGWIWCTNQERQSGWVPVDHVEKLPSTPKQGDKLP